MRVDRSSAEGGVTDFEHAGRVVVVGAGPAGLTAAHELARLGYECVVYEKDTVVGGISRTVEYRGYRFDIGGHRFFTKVAEVERLWHEVMGDDFLARPRLSRIYYRDRFFDYPLRPTNALLGLGLVESVRVAASYARVRLFPLDEERTFEQWVTNRFGRRLFEIFFKTYTEKVWGISCGEIGADWAVQRIKDLDLKRAIRHALFGSDGSKSGVIKTLIDQFHYPPHGPGMLWERWARRLADSGVPTMLGVEVTAVHHDGERIVAATIRGPDGEEERVEAHHVVSSMPMRELVERLDPPAPPSVVVAARALRYRDFLTVVLIVDEPDLFPDNWIYIHSPEVSVGRVQNFKNWSSQMVPDASKTSLGLEYFVQQGDALWSAPDAELIELGKREMAKLGLIEAGSVIDGTVVRMPKAYPVYDGEYRRSLNTIREYIDRFDNLHPVGRNGQHRYNNQDHSMLTALYAARNIDGANYDVWAVNVEAEYHEEAKTDERITPTRVVGRTLEEVLADAFARYDAVALGAAIGIVTGGGLLLATLWALLVGGGEQDLLGLLGSYLIGYRVSLGGALFGALATGVGGLGFGYVLGRAINALIQWEKLLLIRRLQGARTMDPLEA